MIEFVLLRLGISFVVLTVLFPVVWVVMKLLPSSPAGIHRFAWGGLLVVPLLAMSVPMNLPMLPAEQLQYETQSPQRQQGATAQESGALSPRSEQERTSIGGKTSIEDEKMPDDFSGGLKPPALGKASPTRTLPLPLILFGIWFSGLIVILGHRIFLHGKLFRHLRHTREVDAETKRLWERIQAEHGFSGSKIPARLTPSAGPAMVRCGFRTMLLLPETVWEELPNSLRSGVLRHELAHYLYGDVFLSPLMHVLAAVQWFHPLAWFALRKYNVAVEWSCDDVAYRTADADSATLAETFLTIHRNTESLGLYLNTFSRFSTLDRIDRLIRYENQGKEPIMKKIVVVSLLALLFLGGLFRVQLIAQNPPPQRAGGEAVLRATPGLPAPEKDAANPGATASTPTPPALEKTGKLDPKMVRVKGKAFLPDGSPAEGMLLLITGRSKDGKGDGTSDSRVEKNGNFTIRIFSNADYMISIFDPKGKWAAPSQFVTLKSEDYAEEIVFNLEEGIRIIGKVVDETSGKPIPNIELSVSFYNDKTMDGVHAFFKIQADDNGDYGFAALPSEDVYVNVGSLPMYRGVFDVPGENRENVAKLLKRVSFDGQPIINIDFRIPTPFVGKVLFSDGSPASKANIQIVPYRPRQPEASYRGNFVETDENGLFRLTERPRYVFCSIWSRNGEGYVNWFDDDLPKEGEMVFQLQRGCNIKGRLIDSATKKPMVDQLVMVERSSVAEPKRFDSMPLGIVRTDNDGFFNCRTFVVAGVRYELYIVPGRQKWYGGMPGEQRVSLATVIPETPGQKVDLGDLDVDMSKAVAQDEAEKISQGPDIWRDKLFFEQADKVRSGEKKSMLKIYVKPEAKAAADYFEQHQNEEPLASFALFIVPYEKLSEEGKKQQDKWFEKLDAGSFCIANDPITSSKPVGVMTLAQLRGEKDSKWNVPQDDPSASGDWKKSPGMFNPEILKRFLQDMLTGEITAADMVERALRIQPLGDKIDCDRPTPDEVKRCSFKPTEHEGKKGFVVTDPQGKILRMFLDTNGDGKMDQWSYYKNGVAV